MLTIQRVDMIFVEMWKELEAAREKFEDFGNAHEAWGVIREEYLELERAIMENKNPDARERIRAEAIQLGAMAGRLVDYLDNLDDGVTP